VQIPKSFKSFVLEVRILIDLAFSLICLEGALMVEILRRYRAFSAQGVHATTELPEIEARKKQRAADCLPLFAG
jgi:hypothetical protein